MPLGDPDRYCQDQGCGREHWDHLGGWRVCSNCDCTFCHDCTTLVGANVTAKWLCVECLREHADTVRDEQRREGYVPKCCICETPGPVFCDRCLWSQEREPSPEDDRVGFPGVLGSKGGW